MTHPGEGGYTESKVAPVTGEASGWEIKCVKESSYEGEIEVDKEVGNVIKRIQSYDIEF